MLYQTQGRSFLFSFIIRRFPPLRIPYLISYLFLGFTFIILICSFLSIYSILSLFCSFFPYFLRSFFLRFCLLLLISFFVPFLILSFLVPSSFPSFSPFFHISLFHHAAIYPTFWRNKSRLMRKPCRLCVCWQATAPAATNTRATMDELLDASLFMWSVTYQTKSRRPVLLWISCLYFLSLFLSHAYMCIFFLYLWNWTLTFWIYAELPKTIATNKLRPSSV